MATLSLHNICKSFGAVNVIQGVCLDVTDGEFIVIVGPSGCGKSTLLRLIAGLEEVSSGDIKIDGKQINSHTPFERGVAMVFQSYALYPHMTVAQNLGFPLKMANATAREISKKVKSTAEILQLTSLLERRPHQLSGGQKQRVAMGRTIVRDPKLFLFDEPLSNLDADLRIEMRLEIEKLHKRLNATMIYVTHDQVEAMTLADRIVVLRDGVIEQVGAPLDLYENPVNTFVASFLGSPKINFLDVQLSDTSTKSCVLTLSDGIEIIVPFSAGHYSAGEKMKLGIRPEDLCISGDGFRIPFEMELQERLGPTSYLYGVSGGNKIVAEHRQRGKLVLQDLDSLWVNAAHVHLFGPDGRSVRHMQQEGE